MTNSKLRLAVTGLKGQVVSALIERAPKEVEIIALGRPQLELSLLEAVRSTLHSAGCQLIINAAAYTQVDKAESEPEAAMQVNGEGAKNIAYAAAELNIPLIHLSTDYVFDGKLSRPYREDDTPCPIGVYGLSKLRGEEHIASILTDYLILRTSWVYSPFGANFVRTMLKLAEERDEVAVVADQIGNPTSALDIADNLFLLAPKLIDGTDQDSLGIFHLTGSGEASWADVAEFIFSILEKNGHKKVHVRRITSEDYPVAAARPKNSRLDNFKIEKAFGIKLPQWQKSVESCVLRLYGQSKGM